MSTETWRVTIDKEPWVVKTSEPGGCVISVGRPGSTNVIRDDFPTWAKPIIDRALSQRKRKTSLRMQPRVRYVVRRPEGEAQYASKGAAFLIAKRFAKTAGIIDLSREAPTENEHWSETDRWQFYSDGDVRQTILNGAPI